MNAIHKIKFVPTTLILTLFLLCFTNVSRAIDPTSGSHELMSGDLDGDGNIDYLFRGIDKFVLIANDGINIPIILKYPNVVLQRSQPNDRFTILTDISELIAFENIWQPDMVTDVFAANLNGDAYGDLVFLSSGFDYRGFTVYGTSGNDLIIGDYIDESLIGTNVLNNIYELSVFDSDENGTDDLVFYDENGIEIAIAYSDGNSFIKYVAINQGLPGAFGDLEGDRLANETEARISSSSSIIDTSTTLVSTTTKTGGDLAIILIGRGAFTIDETVTTSLLGN